MTLYAAEVGIDGQFATVGIFEDKDAAVEYADRECVSHLIDSMDHGTYVSARVKKIEVAGNPWIQPGETVSEDGDDE